MLTKFIYFLGGKDIVLWITSSTLHIQLFGNYVYHSVGVYILLEIYIQYHL